MFFCDYLFPSHSSDAKCGKIQCHSAAKKPKGTNAVSIDTTIKTGGREVKCRGTYVYSTQDGQGDLPDPGLVVTGTKCGEGKVCAHPTWLYGCVPELVHWFVITHQSV